ncbi:MAG: single-stranded DNA-binding protein [Candidatus Marinimicrobia bacterium]|nr:single-stranded DNA-binding protein [Candidatus Neomarinimicrobiota bacterium]MCF7839347.1 single-stranded DNA-binding protein [Candidatus Neomarinimicrobiota bacterium]MCF7902173.1 single-stranded DNA-binding protein [Candidatus Neomarinimicrobiota bacterium]
MQRGSVNKVILVGRLGQDPEVRYAPSGTAVANFTMATNEVRRDRDGNNQESTDWHKIVAFGKTAEFLEQYIKKGDMIYVEGKLQTRSWEDKDGVKRYVTEVVTNILTPLSSRSFQGNDNGPQSGGKDYNSRGGSGAGEKQSNRGADNGSVNESGGDDYFGDDPLPF